MNSRWRILDGVGESSFVGAQKRNKHAADEDSGTRAIPASRDHIGTSFAAAYGSQDLEKRNFAVKCRGFALSVRQLIEMRDGN